MLPRAAAGLLLLVGPGLLLGCGGGVQDAEPLARNVILISVDTLRADHLGCYGYQRPTSPAIDRLAAAGARLEDVSSVSPWTLPSHASLLTGLYPSHHGVKDLDRKLSPDLPALAEVLAARGFRTAAFVNSYNLAPRFGFDRGFETYDYISEWAAPTGGRRWIDNKGRTINQRAIEWLDRDDPRPFFLFLHYYDVHTDYTPEPRYRKMFVRPYGGRLNGTTAQLVNLRARNVRLAAEDRSHLLDLYDAEIRQFDDVVAELMAYLESQGLARETLVVLTSDHGEEFQEHGSLLHGRTVFSGGDLRAAHLARPRDSGRDGGR